MLKTLLIFVSFQSCLLYLGLSKGVFQAPFLSFTCYSFAFVLLYLWVFHIGSVICSGEASYRKKRHDLKKTKNPENSLPGPHPTPTNREHPKTSPRKSNPVVRFLFSTPGIVLFAVIIRLAFLTYPLSDDVHRYAWEGLIQNNGINPYLHPPQEFSSEFSSDPIFNGINHKDYPTIYPPLSLLIFRGISGIFYTTDSSPKSILFGYKVFFILCDLLVVILLVQLLKVWRKPGHWLALYAWNPLIILYGSGEGHLDSLQSVFITLALLHFRNHRDSFKAGFFSLGCAVMSKYFSIILLPFMVTRKNIKNSWIFCIPFLLFLIYWNPNMFTSLLSFAHDFHYNDFFPRFLRLTFNGPISNIAGMAMFSGGIIWIWLLRKDAPERAMGLSWMWTLLCLPTLHPWYLMPLLIFLVHSPSRPWMILSATMGFNFWVYHHLSQTGNWTEFSWLFYATYVPFVILGIRDFGCLNLPWHRRYPSPRSIDIVVPTLNEEKRLGKFLNSIQSSIRYLNSSLAAKRLPPSPDGFQNKDEPPDVQVYIVDGGSVDNTLSIAANYKINVIESNDASRGHQLATGIKAGQGEFILMLHADATINEAVLAQLYQSLISSPAIEWGILGHSYDFSTLKMRMVEFSNKIRFFFAGIAFGDQGIFVRRHLLNSVGGMPIYRLMEDVELSLRLAPFPCRLNLGSSLNVSTRRWKKKKFTGYTFQVLGLVMTFLTLRRLGVNTNKLTNKMYAIYYGKGIDHSSGK